MSRLVRVAMKDTGPRWNPPLYAELAPSSRAPCTPEFVALMRCLTTDADGLGCMRKYEALKACLRANGLPFT